MGDGTGIEWTDATWNPVTGCTKVSQGCKNCYAERVFPRVYGAQRVDDRALRDYPCFDEKKGDVIGRRPRKFTDVVTHPDRLAMPLKWKRPRRIFVNSMSDLFHEDVRDDFITDVFAVMALAPRHTFQILTKRPQRMRDWMIGTNRVGSVKGRAWTMLGRMAKYAHLDVLNRPWPLPNVWLGVSCEDQETADERIPLLLQTPAAVRWISAEPLLGSVDAEPWLYARETERDGDVVLGIDWVVVGGESGPNARPMHPSWARALRNQCQATGVPFLFKQWGEWLHFEAGSACLRVDGSGAYPDSVWAKVDGKEYHTDRIQPVRNGWAVRVGKKAAGRELDGRTWDEYPI